MSTSSGVRCLRTVYQHNFSARSMHTYCYVVVLQGLGTHANFDTMHVQEQCTATAVVLCCSSIDLYNCSCDLVLVTHAATAHQIAAAIHASQQLGLQNGMLIAVPNPEPSDEHINTAIQVLYESDLHYQRAVRKLIMHTCVSTSIYCATLHIDVVAIEINAFRDECDDVLHAELLGLSTSVMLLFKCKSNATSVKQLVWQLKSHLITVALLVHCTTSVLIHSVHHNSHSSA
jgi:hypothetical protein